MRTPAPERVLFMAADCSFNSIDANNISAYAFFVNQGLGTQLRHLTELLDGAVADAYAREGLSYRPRYTPVMRALIASEPRTISQIAEAAGITQPAATQTVSLMIREGLVTSSAAAADARQREIRLTKAARKLLPKLQLCWSATAVAAASLDGELQYPLSQVLAEAISALERVSFHQRLAEARKPPRPKSKSTSQGECEK